jgi:hypothetical protein
MNRNTIIGLIILAVLSLSAVAATIPADSWDFADVYSLTNAVEVEGTTATFVNIVATSDINFTDSSQQINVVNSTCLNITSGTGSISIGC